MRVPEFILLFILLIPTFAVGQIERDTIYRIDTVLIHGVSRASDTVVTYESSSFKVLVSYKSLISSLKSHIKDHDVEDDKTLLKIMRDYSKSVDERVATVIRDPLMMSRLKFRTMDLLTIGKCSVQNLKAKRNEVKLIRQDYQKRWWTGTQFLTVEGDLVFDVTTGAF